MKSVIFTLNIYLSNYSGYHVVDHMKPQYPTVDVFYFFLIVLKCFYLQRLISAINYDV